MKINNLVLALATLIAIISGCEGVEQILQSAPAAQTPVLDPSSPSDPRGTLKPAGAPFFVSQILKFHVPWPTVIEVAVDGFIMKEQPQGCGDEGCYIVLSNKEAPSGQANFVIQVFPPAYKRRANKLEFETTDVSVNPTLKGEAFASKPLRLILLEAINPVLGGPPSPASIPGSPEFAALHDGGFLDFVVSSPQDADAYYQAIDPTGIKKTLKLWKSINGFNPNDDTLDDAKAVYFNGGDLGLGRSMHMNKKQNGDVSYYVSNYPTVEDARRGTNLIATVAMDYSPRLPGEARFTKFYVYNNVGDGALVTSADLDGNGQKFVPKLCVICHSGSAPSTGAAGDVGARFLPFDLASFQYSSVGGFGRSDQEGEFKKLNTGMLRTNQSDATESLIQDWYGGASLPQAAQNSDAVPSGWQGQGRDDLYLKVVKPSCRACHISRNSLVDFASFDSFNAKSQTAKAYVCSARKMPHAKVTYQKFWLQRLPGQTNQVGLLKQAGLSGWSSTDPCPD